MKIKNLEEIKENSIIVKRNIDITYPNGERKRVLLAVNKSYERQWSMKNSIIALMLHRVVYVVPYNPSVLDVLMKEGFQYTNNIPVLFADGEFPTYEEIRWKHLKEKLFNFQK